VCHAYNDLFLFCALYVRDCDKLSSVSGPSEEVYRRAWYSKTFLPNQEKILVQVQLLLVPFYIVAPGNVLINGNICIISKL
jgi:hypothetical protein